MTAVASPPTLTQHNRPAWGMNGHAAGQTLNQMNPDDVNRMFMPRKNLQRTNSSSSISSNASTSTVVGPTPQLPQQQQQQPQQQPQQQQQQQQPQPPQSQQPQPVQPNLANGGAPITAAGDLASWSNAAGTKKRPQGKAPWPSQKSEYASPDMRVMRRDMVPGGGGGPAGGGVLNGIGPIHVPAPVLQSQGQMVASQQVMPRPQMPEGGPTGSPPVLYLLSLNGTFERKTISVPFSPDTLRIGRQTNAKTVPTPINGFFDSKVLSRQHAEIWADRQGKIWIRDVKSSNGTFVNGTRLSQENRESEPHELQTGDHLELGIDIVSEDQKTVVHHKVAAKVEHAGFLNNSSNLLEMNFGDLDPANGSMMMQPVGAMPYRGRNGSQASMANNGRMAAPGNMMAPQPNGVPHQRQGYFFSPISTEQIVKRLQNEMRTARLQSQDLGRTNQFISALLSKDDIRDMEKLDPAENMKSHLSNGNMNSMPFMRSDSKARFTDPPAPPPQQPLPEKPDVPPLKRGTTERPKANTPNLTASPVRQDGNSSQILQLTRDLDQVKRDYEAQSSRMRDLELKLDQERRARELAEELARRLEQDAATAQMNGVATNPEDGESALEEAFEPPAETTASSKDDAPPSNQAEAEESAPEVNSIETSASHLHTQLESMVMEIRQLKQQLETYKHRAETAEAERDTQRQTLAEMALQIRKDAEAREAAAAKEHKRTRSRSRTLRSSDAGNPQERSSTPARSPSGLKESQESAAPADMPSLSRASTITPYSNQAKGLVHDPVVANSLPYASMLGVVLLGMGLMVYINGWQPQPARLDR